MGGLGGCVHPCRYWRRMTRENKRGVGEVFQSFRTIGSASDADCYETMTPSSTKHTDPPRPAVLGPRRRTWSGWSSTLAAGRPAGSPVGDATTLFTSAVSAKTSCVSAPTVSSVMPGHRTKPRAPPIAIAGPGARPIACAAGASTPHAAAVPAAEVHAASDAPGQLASYNNSNNKHA
eukprot:1194556-Prorocentrum_minimum.AAC.6